MSFLKPSRRNEFFFPSRFHAASLTTVFLSLSILVQTGFAQPVDRRSDRTFATTLDHFQSGLFSVAAEEFAEFRNEHPDHLRYGDALYYEAESRLALGHTDEAIRLLTDFEEAFPYHPFSFQARLTLGQHYFEDGDHENAIRTLSLVLDKSQTDEQAAKALYWMGESSIRAGRDDEGLNYFRQAADDYQETDTAPRAAYALAFNEVRMGRYDDASRSFEELASRFPSSPLSQNIGLALAEVYYEINDFTRAVDEIGRRLPDLSGTAEDRAIFLLAESYNQLRASPRAILNYRRFTDGDPQNPYYRRALYGLAWNYHHEGSYEWAADNFGLVRAADSNADSLSAQAMYYEAVNRKLERRTDEAAVLFRDFATSWPDHDLADNAWFELGILYYELNLWRDANQAFEEVVNRYSDSEVMGEALLHRGNTFIALGDFDSALEMFDQAIDLQAAPVALKEEIGFQKAWLLYRNRQYRLAAPEFLKLYEQNAEAVQAGESLFWAAESFFQLNNYSRAERLFRQYLKDFPSGRHIDAAHYALGWTYFKQESYQRAIPEFERFLSAYRDETGSVPYRSDAQLRLADSYFALKQYADAVRVYGRLAGDGDDYALYQIGQAYSNVGDTFEAISTLGRLLEEYPVSEWREEAQYSLGYLYFLSQDYEQAVDVYKHLIRTYPRDPLAAKAQYGIGDAFFNEGNLGAAVDAYNEVLLRYPNSPFTSDAAAGIQFALIASGDEDQADVIINAFAANNPNSPVIDQLLFRQAEVKYQSGRVDKALAEFHRFIEDAIQEDLMPDAFYYLGIIHSDRDEKTTAMTNFRQVFDRYSESDRFIESSKRLGNLLLESEEFAEAENVFLRLENLRNDEAGVVATARYGRSQALSRLGRSDEAEKLLRDAIAAAPDSDESTPAYLGLARIIHSRGEVAEAENMFEQVVNRSRDEIGAEALYLLGSSQLERNSPDLAVETLGRMPVLYAGYADWIARGYLKQAKSLEALNSAGEAVRVYEMVITLYPNSEFSSQAEQEKNRLGGR
ncbi:MAG: tetratricopeptide repeat protein [Rhodothermia bacterium]|nr:MAG: tetratricopeptide repeat protein [Rhodothermia bacterium]